jgi:small subunit ribosomal protein S21
MEAGARLRAGDEARIFSPFRSGADGNWNDRICPLGAHHQHRALAKEHILQVLVRDNNVDQAMRVLKKKMQREGIFREMKRRRSYEKPSERRVREKAEAVRRIRKLARKQAQREGLIAKPKPKIAGPRRAANR